MLSRVEEPMSQSRFSSHVSYADVVEDYDDINNDTYIVKSNDNIQDYPYMSKKLECNLLDEILSLARRNGIVHGRWMCILTSYNLRQCWDQLVKLCKSGMLDKYVICQKLNEYEYMISVTTSNFDDLKNVFDIGNRFKLCVKTPIVYKPYIILISNMHDSYIYKL